MMGLKSVVPRNVEGMVNYCSDGLAGIVMVPKDDPCPITHLGAFVFLSEGKADEANKGGCFTQRDREN
ncbi:MAG: hypothetical protein PHQ04_01720 [Opitutaceae bacterium]|nr:hypothetical protein [Opitutaceae bacterium]